MIYRRGSIRRETDRDRADVREVERRRRRRTVVVAVAIATILVGALSVAWVLLRAHRSGTRTATLTRPRVDELPSLDAFGGPSAEPAPCDPPWRVARCKTGDFQYREPASSDEIQAHRSLASCKETSGNEAPTERVCERPFGQVIRRVGDPRHMFVRATHERWFYEEKDICKIADEQSFKVNFKRFDVVRPPLDPCPSP
jgi:hypothetical protein